MDAAWAVVFAGWGGGALGFAGSWISSKASARSVEKQAQATLDAVRVQVDDAASARREVREAQVAADDSKRRQDERTARDTAELNLVAIVRESVNWAGSVTFRNFPSLQKDHDTLIAEIDDRMRALSAARLEVETRSPSGLALIGGAAANDTLLALSVVHQMLSEGQPEKPSLPTAEAALSKTQGMLAAIRLERGLEIDGWMTPPPATAEPASPTDS